MKTRTVAHARTHCTRIGADALFLSPFCSQEIEKDPSKFQTTWDDDKKTFALQLFFKL